MKKSIAFLYWISAITAIISAGAGIIFSFGSRSQIVTNIYGQTVTLLGSGVYANDSIMRAGAVIGTDIVVVIVACILIVTMVFFKKKPYLSLVQTGLLAIILYATTCLLLGTTFNRLFLFYILQFSCTFFAFVLSLNKIISKRSFVDQVYEQRNTALAIFMIISGCSVLQWLAYILPVMVFGTPMEIIDVYSTEPTFVLDLGIILPTMIYCGIMLFKRKPIAYQLTPIMLILLTGVAAFVISQTFVQSSLGIVLRIEQLIGLVILFVVLGGLALLFNIRLLKQVKC
ncbi:hypothetical protein [Culicoidibacter larvae]|uniref:Uncharacterized protein n=1 Tax=Culicoidibacter larvae TaxID=2579976 RepID=A0A5R8QA45_9FIRM|nr:hypothetical protein [Culicoidibacter larvae]TLG72519.1 hypothetical protein FEZ08_09020 [Culicoidibacter larvae]